MRLAYTALFSDLIPLRHGKYWVLSCISPTLTNNPVKIFFIIIYSKILAGQATILVSKLHGKLLVLEAGDETRERALMAVRLLASHNALTVIDSLLNDHPLPFDEALVSNNSFFLFFILFFIFLGEKKEKKSIDGIL